MQSVTTKEEKNHLLKSRKASLDIGVTALRDVYRFILDSPINRLVLKDEVWFIDMDTEDEKIILALKVANAIVFVTGLPVCFLHCNNRVAVSELYLSNASKED